MYETLIRLSLDLCNRMRMLFGVFTVLTRHIAPMVEGLDVAMRGAGGGGGGVVWLRKWEGNGRGRDLL